MLPMRWIARTPPFFSLTSHPTFTTLPLGIPKMILSRKKPKSTRKASEIKHSLHKSFELYKTPFYHRSSDYFIGKVFLKLFPFLSFCFYLIYSLSLSLSVSLIFSCSFVPKKFHSKHFYFVFFFYSVQSCSALSSEQWMNDSERK